MLSDLAAAAISSVGLAAAWYLDGHLVVSESCSPMKLGALLVHGHQHAAPGRERVGHDPRVADRDRDLSFGSRTRNSSAVPDAGRSRTSTVPARM